MAPDLPRALSLIDAAHALDPNTHTLPDGTTLPYELHYANKCTQYLDLHFSSSERPPSPELTLAVRAQHFRRWEVPRDSFPRTKAGYLNWRAHLKRRQAEQVEGILGECGFGEKERGKVGGLIRKEGLLVSGKGRTGRDGEVGSTGGGEGNGKGDGKEEEEEREVQVLEDVACLVFLDDQFDEFEKGHDEEKIVNILRKTWRKMGPRGRQLALEMDLSERAKEMVGRALEDEQ